ncbi:MAG: GNAT family N-acetyltransferase [Pseudomonadota bacterium]
MSDAARNIPVIETERLILRGWEQRDVSFMTRFFSSDESKFWGGPLSEGEAWRRLIAFAGQWQINGYGQWAVELRDTGETIGLCGLWHPIDFPEAEMTYALLPDHYGKGYAFEAVKPAIAHVYQALGWTTLASMIEADNAPSVKLATKLGAAFERDFDFEGRTLQVWRHLSPDKFFERFEVAA